MNRVALLLSVCLVVTAGCSSEQSANKEESTTLNIKFVRTTGAGQVLLKDELIDITISRGNDFEIIGKFLTKDGFWNSDSLKIFPDMLATIVAFRRSTEQETTRTVPISRGRNDVSISFSPHRGEYYNMAPDSTSDGEPGILDRTRK